MRSPSVTRQDSPRLPANPLPNPRFSSPISAFCAALVLGVFLSPGESSAQTAPRSSGTATAAAEQKPLKPTIAFSEFFVESPRELKPSPKLLAVDGKHVCLIGFMAKMENPTKGEFYLCPTPVFCDEEGAGSADLPPETVTVEVRGLKGKPVNYIARPISVTGVLTIANRVDGEGHLSGIHLVLDRPQDLPAVKSAVAKKSFLLPPKPSTKVAPVGRTTTH